MNNIINQIVEVLDRYTHEDFINVDFVVFKSDFQEVATEIAALHPLTKIIEEVERLRDEAQMEKYESGTTLAKVLRDGKISAFNQVLSLLTQGNYEGISVEDRLPETDGLYYTFIKTKVSESMGETMFQDGEFMSSFVTHWQPLPSPPKSK